MRELQALRERIAAMKQNVMLINCDTPEDGFNVALDSLDRWAEEMLLKSGGKAKG